MQKKQEKWQQWKKKGMCVMLVCSIPMFVWAPLQVKADPGAQVETENEEEEKPKTTQEKIDEANQKLDQLEEKKEKADEQVTDLKEQQETLSSRLDQLNTKLQELSNKIEETQEKISAKQQEVDKTDLQLQKAKKKEQTQYENMKRRIRYIYENGNISYISAFTNVDSFGEVLNRADYIKQINQYDRKMLAEYNSSTTKVTKSKKKLDKQKKELTSLQEQISKDQNVVLQVVDETQVLIGVKEKQTDQAQEIIDELNKKIEEQRAYEQQLEAQKEREDAARLSNYFYMEDEVASLKAAADATGIPVGPGFNMTDYALLSAIIDCEAEGETYEGKLAVGSVVMNRVLSPKFPNTIAGVIYSPGQFAPVTSGRFAVMLATNGATQECRNAAYEVLNGRITNNFLFFRTIIPGFPATIIDHQMFY
ncbi:MAG: cell wall hydrolase [Lachnospiraceae bacterium]